MAAIKPELPFPVPSKELLDFFDKHYEHLDLDNYLMDLVKFYHNELKKYLKKNGK